MKLLQALGFGAICGLATWIVLDAAEMPDVWFSYSTDECVKVINYDERFNYTCENYPSKYNHVWVQ